MTSLLLAPMALLIIKVLQVRQELPADAHAVFTGILMRLDDVTFWMAVALIPATLSLPTFELGHRAVLLARATASSSVMAYLVLASTNGGTLFYRGPSQAEWLQRVEGVVTLAVLVAGNELLSKWLLTAIGVTRLPEGTARRQMVGRLLVGLVALFAVMSLRIVATPALNREYNWVAAVIVPVVMWPLLIPAAVVTVVNALRVLTESSGDQRQQAEQVSV